MRALLPVWESLVMLGPDSGETGGREGGREDRDETKERHTGELSRVPLMPKEPPLVSFSCSYT